MRGRKLSQRFFRAGRARPTNPPRRVNSTSKPSCFFLPNHQQLTFMPFSMGDDSPPPPWSPPSSSKPLARPVRALPSPPGNSGRDAPPPLSSSSLPSVDEEASWILSDEDGSELSRRATRLPDYGEARDGAVAGRRLVAVNLDEESR